MKNAHGKMRPIEKPYQTFHGYGPLAGWEWRVLKRYQSPEAERENPYARWMVAVRSPMTFGSWDMGDTYISSIQGAVAGQDFTE